MAVARVQVTGDLVQAQAVELGVVGGKGRDGPARIAVEQATARSLG